MNPTPDLDEILAEFGEGIWRLTAGYARDIPDREDLYQEILVAVWRALPGFRGQSSRRTYVYRIAHNRGVTFRARTAARRTRSMVASPSIIDSHPGPEAQAALNEEVERLSRAIRHLPLSLGQPTMLRLEGLSHREIAETMGISENNVAVRLHRARSALRSLMNDDAEESERPA